MCSSVRGAAAIALLLFITFLNIYPVQAQDYSDPLDSIFRRIRVGMQRGEVLGFMRNRKVTVISAMESFLRLGWKGEDLLEIGEGPASFLDVHFTQGVVLCAGYHFYYDGYSDEHLHKGVCIVKP